VKLKELKTVLSFDKVNLFLETKKPIKFEIYGDGEFYPEGELTSVFGKMLSTEKEMYKNYGDHEIKAIYEGECNSVNIDLADLGSVNNGRQCF
jgi:hypothetical protein